MTMSFGPAPTKAEALRHTLIAEGGCICCWAFGEFHTPCEIHHLTIGGHHGQKRRGHAFTVGICTWHHRGGPAGMIFSYGPSYALTPNKFREVFGDDDALLAMQARRLRQVHDSYLISPGKYACPISSIASTATGFD